MNGLKYYKNLLDYFTITLPVLKVVVVLPPTRIKNNNFENIRNLSSSI